MSTDPFDEAPHDPYSQSRPVPAVVHRPTASSESGFAASCVSPHTKGSPATASPKGPANFGQNDPHANTERAAPSAEVLHRRGLSIDHSLDSGAFLVPPSLHHGRTRSSDIDDHMAGSVYAPHELCPKCGFARSSSIFCHVSKMHHGTDEPLVEPKPKGFFARLRGESDEDVKEDALAAEPSTDQLPTDKHDPAAAATPKKKEWSFFKTKEEKQLLALEEEEEEARRKLSKSKSNPEGERFAFEQMKQNLEQGAKEILKREKARNTVCKAEHEGRENIATAEEKARKDLTKDEGKARKKLPNNAAAAVAPSSSGSLSAQPSLGSVGSPANHNADVSTPCAHDGEGASLHS